MINLPALIRSILLLVWVTGFAIFAFWPQPSPEVDCYFDRIPGTYRMTADQVHGNSRTVIVKRDDRAFLFDRDQILACKDRDQ